MLKLKPRPAETQVRAVLWTPQLPGEAQCRDHSAPLRAGGEKHNKEQKYKLNKNWQKTQNQSKIQQIN